MVIAISGTSGAGKTTLVQKVAERLGDAVTLHFDDYFSVSQYPADARAWVDAGADPDAWRTAQLADDLRSLRAGQTIRLPREKGTREPKPYIVLEEPFGRARTELAESIDFVVYLDLPLEVALARKLLREYGWVAEQEILSMRKKAEGVGELLLPLPGFGPRPLYRDERERPGELRPGARWHAAAR